MTPPRTPEEIVTCEFCGQPHMLATPCELWEDLTAANQRIAELEAQVLALQTSLVEHSARGTFSP